MFKWFRRLTGREIEERKAEAEAAAAAESPEVVVEPAPPPPPIEEQAPEPAEPPIDEAPSTPEPFSATVTAEPPPPSATVDLDAVTETFDAEAEARELAEHQARIQQTVSKTRTSWFDQMSRIFARADIDDDLYDELEEILIQADVGVDTTEYLLDRLRERVRSDRLTEPSEVRAALKEEMVKVLETGDPSLTLAPEGELTTILIVGVNGSGKTTSIGKLTYRLRRDGFSVVLAAGDTFRAAAIEQLQIWGERTGAEVVANQPGSDSAAVIFDAMHAAMRRNADVMIADTAGRLQTKYNLMEELKKVRRVMQKADPKAPTEVLLVIDATTGQNGLSQAKHFADAVGLSGLILAKLDGTAKGGIVFAIAREMGIPIKLIGTGEKVYDLEPFDPQEFVDALFGDLPAPALR